MLNPQDGRPPRNGGKSVLIGCFFIQRSPEGAPLAAGRIVKGFGPGHYMLAYTFRHPGVAALSPSATPEEMSNHNFELWAHEANWQRAYAGADAPRKSNEPQVH